MAFAFPPTPLIGVADLARVREQQPVRILDVRWRLDRPEGRPAYLAGHLPGAVYVDLEQELTRPGHPEEGRHPLPHVADLQEAARRWGVRGGDVVVAYDDNDGVAAARAWWLLRRRGVDIRVLDGGLRAWIEDGQLLEGGDVRPPAGDVVLADDDPGTATIEQTARAPQEGVLIDARAPLHYRGAAPTPDPSAGHIPGAINVPTLAYVAADGRLRPPDEVRRTLTDAGADPDAQVVVYCSSGIAAAHTTLALASARIDARLFPGSWSRWSRSRGRPVAVGPTPWGEVFAR
ncbi:sulfurtransferase [Microbacterium sp. cx-59]|uniref:sulfurtransferase n=1 Tax=Microbacterium sp. cx-59 TaxID=2891207 RepID=UPI001E41EAF9|nr:sulfurtransferase [Microbacterium sp. cx-59]MCC4909180.1 sulfurtransferase [Microbacterium sp. cx-59]